MFCQLANQIILSKGRIIFNIIILTCHNILLDYLNIFSIDERDASRNWPHCFQSKRKSFMEYWKMGSVRKCHALLESLSGNYPRPVHECLSSMVEVHTSLTRPSARSDWPPKANHFELGLLAIPTRKISGVTPGFRSSRQHRSIFRNGSWRRTFSLQLSDYRTAPELPYNLQPFVNGVAQLTGNNFASFICNQDGCCLIERRYNRSQFKRVKFQRN